MTAPTGTRTDAPASRAHIPSRCWRPTAGLSRRRLVPYNTSSSTRLGQRPRLCLFADVTAALQRVEITERLQSGADAFQARTECEWGVEWSMGFGYGWSVESDEGRMQVFI